MAPRPTFRELVLIAVFAFLWLVTSSKTVSTPLANLMPTNWEWKEPPPQEKSYDSFLDQVRIRWGSGLPPVTEVLGHIPGMTMFNNLYSFNGTLVIVTNDPESLPELRLITSAGFDLSFDPVDQANNLPTDKDIRVVSPQEAKALFGTSAARMDGLTFISSDPPQFLHHYFHFVIEIILHGMWRLYAILDPHITHDGHTFLPPPRRLIFTHCDRKSWRDSAGLNIFFLRTAFPGLGIEFADDWEERANIGRGGRKSETVLGEGGYPDTARAIVMDKVVIGDRSAGGLVWKPVKSPDFKFPYIESLHFWAPIRVAVAEYATATKELVWPADQELRAIENGIALSDITQQKPVITYVDRQKTGRRLLDHDHAALVKALEEGSRQGKYEFVDALMETMNKFDQIELSSRTTIMLGVHGNGLSNAAWMKPNRRSALIEILYPPSFVWDYHSVGDAIGVRHWSVENDTVRAGPAHPALHFENGLHGPNIPAYAPAILDLIEKRLDRPLYDPKNPPIANPVAWWSTPRPGGQLPGGIRDQYGYSPSDQEDEE